MDVAARIVPLLFFVCLPGSLYCCVLLVASSGFLRDRAQQPRWYRFVLDWLPNLGPKSLGSPRARGAAVIGLIFFNSIPLLELVLQPSGITAVLDLLYFFVLAGLFLPMMRVIAREISGPRA
jgi:hypothetical protein